MITVMMETNGAAPPLDRHELAACLENMLRATDQYPSGVELVCVRDAAMAGLNEECMRCPGPTNILAFPARNPAGVPENGMVENPAALLMKEESPLLGSLVLSIDTLRREARLYGQESTAYCRRLLAHGLAHVLGYDHGPEMDAVCLRMLEGDAV